MIRGGGSPEPEPEFNRDPHHSSRMFAVLMVIVYTFAVFGLGFACCEWIHLR